MARELWDAYDREGNLLGFDLVRGEPLPEGAYHMVAEIYSVTHDGRVLMTLRSPGKSWGNHWEITAGSVVKGEDPMTGALRELQEETGIRVTKEDLHPVYVQARMGIEGYPSIYHSFVIFFDPAEQTISLQERETADWQLIPYGEYKKFIMTDVFTPGMRDRFLDNQEAFDRLIEEHIRVK